MLNWLDIIIGVLMVFYLLRAMRGGILRLGINLLIIIAALIIFGLAAQLMLSLSFATPLHRSLQGSYFADVSYSLIKLVYPTVEKSAPRVDVFIKKKIINPPSKIDTQSIKLPRLETTKLPTLE